MGRPFQTTVIGSYWRRDSQELRRPTLSKAEGDEACRWAIGEQVRAGLDIITDGEQRRESFITYFQHRIPGFSFKGPVPRTWGRHTVPVPRVVEEVYYAPIGMVEEWRFARSVAPPHVEVKATCAGPHILSRFCQDEVYGSPERLAMEIAEVLNQELKALVKAGCPFIQLDEPHWSGEPGDLKWAARAFNQAVEGLGIPVGLHVCMGNPKLKRIFPNRRYHELLEGFRNVRVDQVLLEYATHPYDVLSVFDEWDFQGEFAIGVVDVKSLVVETPEEIVRRVERALDRFPPERLLLTSECGYIYTPPEIAFGKMKALVEGAQILRGR